MPSVTSEDFHAIEPLSAEMDYSVEPAWCRELPPEAPNLSPCVQNGAESRATLAAYRASRQIILVTVIAACLRGLSYLCIANTQYTNKIPSTVYRSQEKPFPLEPTAASLSPSRMSSLASKIPGYQTSTHSPTGRLPGVIQTVSVVAQDVACIWITSGLFGLLLTFYLWRSCGTVIFSTHDLDVVFVRRNMSLEMLPKLNQQQYQRIDCAPSFYYALEKDTRGFGSSTWLQSFEPRDLSLGRSRTQPCLVHIDNSQPSKTHPLNSGSDFDPALICHDTTTQSRSWDLQPEVHHSHSFSVPCSAKRVPSSSSAIKPLEEPLLRRTENEQASGYPIIPPAYVNCLPFISAILICLAQVALKQAFEQSPPLLWTPIAATLSGCELLQFPLSSLEKTDTFRSRTDVILRRTACCVSCIIPGIAQTVTVQLSKNTNGTESDQQHSHVYSLKFTPSFFFGASASVLMTLAVELLRLGTLNGMSEFTHFILGSYIQGAIGILFFVAGVTARYFRPNTTFPFLVVNKQMVGAFAAGLAQSCSAGLLTWVTHMNIPVDFTALPSSPRFSFSNDATELRTVILPLYTMVLGFLVWATNINDDRYNLDNFAAWYAVRFCLPLFTIWLCCILRVYVRVTMHRDFFI